MTIFKSVLEAIRAGYEIEHPAIPDSEGYLHARIIINGHWARALVAMRAA